MIDRLDRLIDRLDRLIDRLDRLIDRLDRLIGKSPYFRESDRLVKYYSNPDGFGSMFFLFQEVLFQVPAVCFGFSPTNFWMSDHLIDRPVDGPVDARPVDRVVSCIPTFGRV